MNPDQVSPDVAQPTRRDVLKTAVAGSLLAMLPGCTEKTQSLSNSSNGSPIKPGAFRFVHFTDIHVQRELNGDKGLAKALGAAEALRPRPDFILTGGDLVYDVYEQTPQRSRELFTLFNSVIADNTSIRLYPCIGNHDIFGWKSPGVDSGTTGYGRAMARDYLKLAETHYHFDHKGWRFFVLDNILPSSTNKNGYKGGLAPDELEWFTAELKNTPRGQPVITCEHIPMITVTPYAWEKSL